MSPTVIENPILNSPYREPSRHFQFDDDGITSEIAEGRRSIELIQGEIGGAETLLP